MRKKRHNGSILSPPLTSGYFVLTNTLPQTTKDMKNPRRSSSRLLAIKPVSRKNELLANVKQKGVPPNLLSPVALTLQRKTTTSEINEATQVEWRQKLSPWNSLFAEAYFLRWFCKGLADDMKGTIYDANFSA
jgi:hypothetical protein